MKKFIDEFKYQKEKQIDIETNDYNAFPNKELLDKLRNEIIQNLIDNNVKNGETMDDFVKKQIDKIVDRYDLSTEERSYIYDLIDNEINGFGPITGLLQNNDLTEIMVNSPSEIYIELNGRLLKDETVSFINNDHITRVIQRLI